MPYINIDEDVFIDVRDFYRELDDPEKEQLADLLTEDGFLDELEEENRNKNISGFDEETFESSLKKLRGKWNMLSKEEEETIVKIASKF